MFGKAVAGTVVCMWLALFGVEFFEDLGFIQYSTPGMDEAMDEALDGFGNAIVSSADSTEPVPASLALPYHASSSFLCPHFFSEPFRVVLAKQTSPPTPLYKRLKIKELNQVFLI